LAFFNLFDTNLTSTSDVFQDVMGLTKNGMPKHGPKPLNV